MEVRYRYRDQSITLQAEQIADSLRVSLPDGSARFVNAKRCADNQLSITEGERTFRVPFHWTSDSVDFAFGGRTFKFEPPPAIEKPSSQSSRSGVLTAPMVGTVTEVLVSEGDEVRAYQPLVVIEAMKVLAAIESPFQGTVAKLYSAKGDRVSHGAPVIEIEPI